MQRLSDTAMADKRAAAEHGALWKQTSEQQLRDAEQRWAQERQQLKASSDTAWAQLSAAQAKATELREQLQRTGAEAGGGAAEVARLQAELANALKAWRVEKAVLQNQRDGFSSQVGQLRDKIGELSQELADMKEAAKAGVAVAALRWKAGAKIKGGAAASPATPPPPQASPTTPVVSPVAGPTPPSRTSPLRAQTSTLSAFSPQASTVGARLAPQASTLSTALRPQASTLSTRLRPQSSTLGPTLLPQESIISTTARPTSPAALKLQTSSLSAARAQTSAAGSRTSSGIGKAGGQDYAAALQDAKSMISSWASGAAGRTAATRGSAILRAESFVSNTSRNPGQA